MAQYDGSIRIGTKIDEKGFEDGKKKLEADARNAAKSIDASIKQMEKEFETFDKSILKTAQTITSLTLEADKLKNLQIPTKEYTAAQKDVEKLEKSLLDAYTRKEKFLETGGDRSSRTFKNIEYDIDKLETKLRLAEEDLQSLVRSGEAFTLGSDTEQFVNISNQIEDLTHKMQDEQQRAAQLQSDIQSKMQEKIQAEAAEEERLAQIRENAVVGNRRIVKIAERRKQLLQEIADMEAAGIGVGYRQYDSAKQEIAEIEQKIRDYNNGIEEVKENYRKLGQIAKSALSSIGRTVSKTLSDAFRHFGDVAKKSLSSLSSAAKKSLYSMSSLIKRVTSSMLSFGKSTKSTNNILNSGFKNILKYGLGIRSLYALINKLRTAIKEGFTNLYNGSESFKNTVDELKASALTLKNSFAAAFRPLVEVAIPYIKKLLDYMTQVVNAAGQLMAALLGRKTYTRAIKQTTAALKEETKAQNKQLSSLDKLNNLTSQKDAGGDNGAAGMFEEEVPISDKWKNIADWLKDMWDKANFYDLGKLLGEKLKEALDSIPWDKIKETARKIGKSIASFINGFIEVEGLGYSIGKTLVEAMNTGFEFLNAFVHELHWDSVGKFIAETINGFSQNIDWNLIYDTFVTGAKGLGDAINSFVDNLDWEAISSNIANFVNTFAATVLTFFTTVDWEEVGKRIGETLTETIKKIDFEKVGRAIGSVIQAAIDFAKNIISELSFEDVVSAITDLLKGFFEEANWTDIAKIALSLLASALVMQSSILKLSAVALAILSAFQDELLALDWKKAGETVGETFKDFFSFIATTIENIDWWAVGEKVKEFLVGIDWNGVFDALCEAIGAAFGGLMAFLGGLLANAVVDAVDYFKDKIEEAGGNVVEGILVGIAEALVNIGEWIKEHIFKPFMDGFKKAFEIHSPSKVMQIMGKYIVDGLLSGLKEKWNDVVSWITSKIQWLKDKLSGISGSVKSAFSGGSGFSGKSRSSAVTYSMPSASPYSANPAFSALSNAEIPAIATGQAVPTSMKQHFAASESNSREAGIASLASAIEEASVNAMAKMNGGSGNNNGNSSGGNNVYEFSVDGMVFFRIMQKYAEEYKKQNGGKIAFS